MNHTARPLLTHLTGMALLLAAAALLATPPAEARDRWEARGHWTHHGGHHHGWRPYVGLHVHSLPVWRSVVVVGGVSYLLANGIYYREHLDGGYVVVPPPVQALAVPSPESAPAVRQFVYPRQGQSPERQAADEYDCHRWAADQSGFDPVAAATGQAPAADGRRPDYQRAKSACLEGRGYTVR